MPDPPGPATTTQATTTQAITTQDGTGRRSRGLAWAAVVRRRLPLTVDDMEETIPALRRYELPACLQAHPDPPQFRHGYAAGTVALIGSDVRVDAYEVTPGRGAIHVLRACRTMPRSARPDIQIRQAAPASVPIVAAVKRHCRICSMLLGLTALRYSKLAAGRINPTEIGEPQLFVSRPLSWAAPATAAMVAPFPSVVRDGWVVAAVPAELDETLVCVGQTAALPDWPDLQAGVSLLGALCHNREQAGAGAAFAVLDELVETVGAALA